MAIRDLVRNNISNVPFEKDLTQEEPWASFYANHVDLPRMRKGKMGGQFWSAYVSCESQFKNSIQSVLGLGLLRPLLVNCGLLSI